MEDFLISFESGDLSEHLRYLQPFMNTLSKYCILCKLKIEIGDYSFPPDVEDFDVFESFLNNLVEEEDEQEMQDQYEQEMADFFEKGKPILTIKSIDIKENSSFGSMASICQFLSDALSLHSLYPDIVGLKTSSYFVLYSNIAIGKVYELKGYWTAKMEEKKRNAEGGGAAMKKRGKDNAKAIKSIMDEMGLKSLKVFRTDKRLREEFLLKAQKATFNGAPLSVDRISKIARSVSKS